MLLDRAVQVLAVQVPAREVQVAVGGDARRADAGQRQPRHVVGAGAQHLDPCGGRGGDGAAQAYDKHANTSSAGGHVEPDIRHQNFSSC